MTPGYYLYVCQPGVDARRVRVCAKQQPSERALDRALGGERRPRYLMNASVDWPWLVALAIPVRDASDGVRRMS
jgi:hypothetical protein